MRHSVADHSTEQPIFGPGPIAGHNYLYFAQASSSAYGAPDSTWGNRPEHLLTAAILRLDTTAHPPSAGPLNVKTPDAGGTYNPSHVAPTTRLAMATMDSSNNLGGNSIFLQSYRKAGMFPSVTTYEGPLSIGETRAQVGG